MNDGMSVHELVNLLVDIDARVMRKVSIEEAPAIESALRKACIREASVGVVKLSHNGVASDYDIIPKGDDAPLFTGLLATPEELAYMKREIELHEDYELNVGKIPEIK